MLLQDSIPFSYHIDEAASAAAGRLTIRGRFQHADVKNGNGRVYSREILEREVGRLSEDIGRRRVTGELDHPADSEVRLSRASHLITGLRMLESGEVEGTLEILEDSPYGKQAASLARHGFEFGISSRGTGSTQVEEGVERVGEDFRLHTFDLVHNPSTRGAHARAVVESQSSNGDTSTMSPINEQSASRQEYQQARESASRILSIPMDALTEATIREAEARVESLAESLDRLSIQDPGLRSNAERLVHRLEEKLQEMRQGGPLLEDRLAAAERLIGEMVRLSRQNESNLRAQYRQRVARLRESLREQGRRATLAESQVRQLRSRNAVAMEAGEQVLSRLQRLREARRDEQRIDERRRTAARRDSPLVETMRQRRPRYRLTEGEAARREGRGGEEMSVHRALFEDMRNRTGLT